MAATLRLRYAHSFCLHCRLLFAAFLACYAVQIYITAAAAGPRFDRREAALHENGYQGIWAAAASEPKAAQNTFGGTAQASDRGLEEMSQPALAAAYMDSLLADPVAAQTRLLGDFTKRSKVAVIYMCFERMEMIHRAIPAILGSEGLAEFDFFISQDGGAASIFENGTVSIPSDIQFAYIRHPANLCTGLHHHFVKAFAFDIMGYDILLIVEEDNIIHPQALQEQGAFKALYLARQLQSLQLLRRMAQLSVSEPEIGIVSLLDMDMSPFLDAERFAAGLIPVVGHMGHLWVFGLHRVKYELARGCLRDYYDVIKGHEYRAKHLPPLREAIQALMQAKGFPPTTALSQDRWFINSLAKFGFAKRYQTLFRFFKPIGNYGLHFRMNESRFYDIFGHSMYDGRIDPNAAFDVTKDPNNCEAVKTSVRERLTALFGKYRTGASPSEVLVNNTYHGILEGRLNGLEVVRDITGKTHY
ncbi:hypothetical protein VOLCADRAFT_88170 [Volvox carteri f. nagariensis]|uniref:Uncharacterized protein n=1 Tax=Volvox carteri f. nagariensis TaxID=3068 RepID=D8TNG5_VOLCA|nr:uncharacterized protein VOLCADRAFT_88170 [Volvox carteri f. nagariensis]EFJ50989.1 hypothetical protein VOLCADRAFT_88170 [Volvox carteri f. nagariensis]|eukprot:XP_002948001.1 hypothetical protein VOLCADRAFT_88170 [Volvox carteri f. nagariensis]